jgi:hypothetical protein
MRAIVEGGDHAGEFLAARHVASINSYGRAGRADIHARGESDEPDQFRSILVN